MVLFGMTILEITIAQIFSADHRQTEIESNRHINAKDTVALVKTSSFL
jgi:hypothetical protein